MVEFLAFPISSDDWRAIAADGRHDGDYHEVDLDDDTWVRTEVPGHWRSSPEFANNDRPLLYRRRFTDPQATDTHARGHESDRVWLVFDGIFYTSDVWLDGTYLGDTEGYFFPHGFEVTEQFSDRRDHLLALEVGCAPQQDRRHKRNLTGVFQHWDMADPTWNPGGIWRDVRIERSGPVRILHMRTLCRDANESAATVFVRAVLDTVEATTVRLRTHITACDGDTEPVESIIEQSLAAGENRIEWTVTVPDPRLWWPAALGDQALYDVTVDVLDETGRPSDRRQRRTGLRRIQFHNWICSVNGERMFLKGSNIGPTKMALGEATPEEIRADVALARSAGLDMLRVHGHIGRPELYEAADETGLLLWQDLPLQWGYARSVRRQARRQAREAVDILGHHPSVAVWCGHNEPFTLDIEPGRMGDPDARPALMRSLARKMFLPTWNKSVLDHSVHNVLDHTDGTRLVVPHSGVLPGPPSLDGTDSHLWLGWHHGDERYLERLARLWPRVVRFVTEFGAQAIPTDASFLEPHRWPDLDWDRAARIHGMQLEAIERHTPRAQHTTFESWRNATQRYQADVIRHHILTLRRLKYRPCGGFAQFCLADSGPAVSWSVLDHLRNPKEGFDALVEACRPTVVAADRLLPEVTIGEFVSLDIHVVSDRRSDLGNLIVEARVDDGTSQIAGREWWGEVGADSCVRVGRLDFVVPQVPGGPGGRLDLEITLRRNGSDEPLSTYRDHTVVTGEFGPR